MKKLVDLGWDGGLVACQQAASKRPTLAERAQVALALVSRRPR